jgi:hypothetical protein
MRKKITFFLSILLILSAITMSVNAQKKLLYYWNFNFVTGLKSAKNPANFGPFYSNYSYLGDTTTGKIYYTTIPGTSAAYSTYFDVTTGDTVNARLGDSAGNCLRLRNPADSMQLLFYMPSIHYQNLVFKYEVQKSSATHGANVDSFFYSIDSGMTWRNSGVSPVWDSVPISGLWTNPGYSINITDPLAFNNSKLVFKIKFDSVAAVSTGGVTGTSGNNRIDNVTLEGDSLSAAPVILLNFDASTSSGSSVLLTWTTSQEINSKVFEVEKSDDGKNFTSIGEVNAAGNSSVAHSYSLVDKQPLTGENYYRLKTINIDGTFSYSSIESIDYATKGISVYPNPAHDQIIIEHLAGNHASILITDLLGRIITRTNIAKGNTTTIINISFLNKGQYFLEYVDENYNVITKLNKL